MGYDCHFRQQAAATPTRWDVVNSTLWNLAFSGRACTSCCCCFSLSHCYSDCEILLNTQGEHTSSPGHFPPNNIPPKNIPSYMTRPTSQSQLHQNQTPLTWLPAATSPVCCSYSESPKPGCLFPIAGLNTPATAFIKIPKSSPSAIRPSSVSTRTGIYIDSMPL